jgi:hypothetical protein
MSVGKFCLRLRGYEVLGLHGRALRLAGTHAIFLSSRGPLPLRAKRPLSNGFST